MTKEAYLRELKKIDEEAELKKRILYKECALENAKFKIGDLIKNERFAFVIDEITVYVGFDLPHPVYHGFELKKDLTPKHNRNRVAVYDNNAELVGGVDN